MATLTKNSTVRDLQANANVAASATAGVTITRSGTTASVSDTSHGFSNGNAVRITGAEQNEYNGVFVIANVSANAFDYTLSADPGESSSGTELDQLVDLATTLDLSSAFGAVVTGRILNDATAPTISAKLLIGLANVDTDHEYRYREILDAGTVNAAETEIHIVLGPEVMFARFVLVPGSAQPVDWELEAQEFTSVGSV